MRSVDTSGTDDVRQVSRSTVSTQLFSETHPHHVCSATLLSGFTLITGGLLWLLDPWWSILWAGVQPTLDPYAEAIYSRPIALTLGGEEFSVNDVCKCMRDCRVGWAE